MKVSKEQVVGFIRARGDDDHAERAQRELPDSLELPGQAGLLAQFGVDSSDVDDESVWG